MNQISNLEVGKEYSKIDLADLLDEPSLSSVREGIYYCKKSSSALFFVDLEKKGKEERLNYNDFFDGGTTIKEIGRYLSNLGALKIAPLIIARTVGGDLV